MEHSNLTRLTAQRTPFDCAPAEAVLQIVQDYWETLRHQRQIPLRSDVTPDALNEALPYCFIAERVARDVHRLRVAGQGLHSLLGMDPRGMPLSVFLSEEARAVIAPIVEGIFDQPRIVEIALQTNRTLTRPAATARVIYMPLRDEAGRTTRIFGAFVTDRDVRLGQRRFNLADSYLVQDRTLRLSGGNVRVVATAQTPATAIPPTPKRPARGATLRLVVDNT